MLFLTPSNSLRNPVKIERYLVRRAFPAIEAGIHTLCKGILFSALFLLLAFLGNAQQAPNTATCKITGRIVDSATGQPVQFASISLALQTDDKEINGMMTDDKG